MTLLVTAAPLRRHSGSSLCDLRASVMAYDFFLFASVPRVIVMFIVICVFDKHVKYIEHEGEQHMDDQTFKG